MGFGASFPDYIAKQNDFVSAIYDLLDKNGDKKGTTQITVSVKGKKEGSVIISIDNVKEILEIIEHNKS